LQSSQARVTAIRTSPRAMRRRDASVCFVGAKEDPAEVREVSRSG